MSERDQKLAELQAKLAAIDLYYQDIKAKKEAIQQEIRKVENSVEVGDRVYREELCKRGCCVDAYYEGVVKEILPDGDVLVTDDSGTVHKLWNVRLKKPK